MSVTYRNHRDPVMCAHCGGVVAQPAGAINRALRRGGRVYCGKSCSGIGRRKHKTSDQKKEEKRKYDALYRVINAEKLKREKAAYYQRTKDREKERDARKKRAHLHAEYCRRPEYRAWKASYDQRYRANKCFGLFAEAHIALLQLEKEIDERADFYELARQKGTVNKTLKRKREYAQHQ